MSDPDQAADARRDDEQQRIAEAGDGLAAAVQGKRTGQNLEDDQDTADGEDATS